MAIQPAVYINGLVDRFDQWITDTAKITISLATNGRLVVDNAASNQTRELRTQCYLVAVIMNVFASLFPSCCHGTAEINVEGRIYFIARSEIKNVFACNENLPCNFDSSKKNAEDLEVIALQYFTKKAFNPKMIANLVHQGVQMLGGLVGQPAQGPAQEVAQAEAQRPANGAMPREFQNLLGIAQLGAMLNPNGALSPEFQQLQAGLRQIGPQARAQEAAQGVPVGR